MPSRTTQSAAVDERSIGGALEARFGIDRVLKRGSGVVTYAATERATGRRVAIKAASTATVDEATRRRLEHEAAVLSEIESPFLARLLDSRIDDAVTYLVTSFAEGTPLSERVAAAGPLSIADSIAVGRALMEALQSVHHAGIVHRDVKPANLIVGEGSPPEPIALIDFGFARSSRLGRSIRDLPVGTALYVSPEQAGLVHTPVDQRSDLYSAGAVLFECLAGQPPFRGADVGEVLREHVVAVPADLSALRPEVPEVLGELVDRLLRKDPDDRYQSAEAVAADLAAIEAAIARGAQEPVIVLGLRDPGRRSLTEPEFVGRTGELEAMESRCGELRAGKGGIVLLEAESGGGKSRLLDEIADCTTRHGVWATRGQGRDQVAAYPYQLLEGVVAGVVSRASSDRAFSARLERKLAGYEDALIAAMPELAEVLDSGPPVANGTEEHGERRSMRALSRLLDVLGEHDAPAVVLLDDCQWSDELTIRLLRHWAAGRGRRAVLIVAAFRSEEVPADHPLRTVDALERLGLAPLDPADVRRLVESMAGPLPGDAVALVERLAEGNPFMAAEVLRGLVETGALVPEESGWRVVSEAMADAQSSRRAAAVLARRLERIPAGVLDVLLAGAILGKSFDLGLAAALSGQPAARVSAAVSEAEHRHVVWAEPGESRATFVHDKLRETLLARLSEVELRDMHRAAAERIELTDADRSFELAYHFDAAGDPGRALPHALRAAEEARARHGLDIAARQYEIAARGLDGADPETRLRVAGGAGDVAMLRGLYDDAEREFLAARKLAGDRLAAARLDGRLGELAFKRGDVTTASSLLEQGLRQLGEPVPRWRIGLLGRLAREVLVQAAHSVAPRLFLARRRLGDSGERPLLALRLYSRLAHAYWFQRGMLPCAWAHLRELNLAERYPATSELGMAYSEHAPVMTMIPWYRRGVAYGRRALATYRELGDRWGEGHALAFYGVVLYAAGRWEEALDQFRPAVKILERTGDQWEVNTAAWHIALCLYRLGHLAEAIEAARQVHAAALELGDRQASGIALGIWAKASNGAVPRELIDAELRNPSDDVHTRAEVLQADALSHLRAGRVEPAVRALESAEALVGEAGLRQEYVAPVWPWLLTALRTRLEATSALARDRRRRRLREMRRAARRAGRVARSYCNNLPHVLRERGMLLAMAGRPRRAGRLLDRSLAVAERQGARHERALTLAARGDLGAALGWPEADAERAAAGRELAKLRPAEEGTPSGEAEPEATLSLADRFSSVLEEGRRIASGLSEDSVYEAVNQATRTLLRVESCAVLAVDRDRPLAGELPAAPHRSVIERALADERPVIATDERTDASESLMLADVRSVLCAPIMVRGRAVACIYASHDRIENLFGPDEERLAAFIAALAGAALENSEGFSEVQDLSRRLEQRVRERTGELEASKEEMQLALSVLEATLDSTADGLLVVDRAGKIVRLNRKFAEMWRIPEEILESRDDKRAIGFVLDQLVSPKEFVAKIEELYGNPEVESYDEIHFKDGRVFERYSKPQVSGGQVIGRVWSFRDVTHRKRHEMRLRHLADHDPLTGMFNRRRFEEEVERARAYASRYRGEALALLLVDLDNFKYVNDTLGHRAGDQVIKSIARVLEERIRRTDIPARLGGDEFGVILPRVGEGGARRVADDLLEAIRGHRMVVNGQRVSVTGSIGIAVAGERTEADQLLVDVDLAMYAAKDAGKDRASLHTPERAQEARERARFSWVERIRRALDEDLFELHCQPIVDISSGRTSQYELLLRLADRAGLVAPAAFLPSAERLGLVQAIDRWVIGRAIALIEEARSDGRELRLEVNLSAKSIEDEKLPGLIGAQIEAARIEPSSLIFEVTETAAIANMERAAAFANQLSELGCEFALDDFGAGFGSFLYLKHFPVSYLKIDGDFITDLLDDPMDQNVVRAIVGIARDLGKRTIAEFVGDEPTLRRLREYGVDYAQGYHTGRPRPIEDAPLRSGAPCPS